MIYTTADLTAVQAAIIELATGKRVTKITFSNGETVEYGVASLQGLKQIRAEIQSELSGAESTKRYFRTMTSKGL
ncbi:MAG: hypothetical protein DRH26_06725 [Deltaproteobacteria bacterium]|nr:MAG: hypothetical protein DRH26_06725 [Deltaproteobacteria bacterium]